MSLKPCPSSPNCVSSQADPDDAEHFMNPVPFSIQPSAVLEAAVNAVTSAGGEVTATDAASLDAVFASGLFRFKDDVRFEVDEQARLLHFRSASRTGHSDLGVNRKRMESLLAALAL